MPFPLIAALIGGGAMLGGALINKSASDRASDAAERAADQNAQVNREIYQQTRGDLAPFRQFGGLGMDALARELGLTPATGGSTGQPQSGPNYAGYVDANPDLAAEWANIQGRDSRFPTKEAYGQWHHQQFGPAEPWRQVPQFSQTGGGKPEGGNAGVSPLEGAEGAPNLLNAPRPEAPPAPTFERPTELAAPEYERPEQADFADVGPAPEFSRYFDPNNIQADPSYQWRLNQGMDALNSRFGARGMLRSGSAIKGALDYSQGAASQEFGNIFNRAMQRYQTDLGQHNTNRSQSFNIFANQRDARNRVFESDRSTGLNQWQLQQGRQDQQFSEDRGYGTDAWRYGVARNDNIFDTDRGFQAGRQDQRIANLFGVTGIGQNAAAGTAAAGNVFASNQTANNNMRAQNTANAAIAGAQGINNLIGAGAQTFGYYGAGKGWF